MLSNTKLCIITLLKTNSRVLEALGKVLKQHDVSLQQFNVLRILRGQKGEAANLSTVQDRMVNRMSNTTRIVDKLIDKNFVQRSICEKNRRKIELFITEEGRSLLTLLDQVVDEVETQLTDQLNTDEKQNLVSLLKKINI
jgi:DNA-binding MarR family transcriptional regulator